MPVDAEAKCMRRVGAVRGAGICRTRGLSMRRMCVTEVEIARSSVNHRICMDENAADHEYGDQRKPDQFRENASHVANRAR